MQRTGSRPIGIIIAVVVIALCVYGAIQLASSNQRDNPASTPNNQQVATDSTPSSPAGSDTTTNRPNSAGRPGPAAAGRSEESDRAAPSPTPTPPTAQDTENTSSTETGRDRSPTEGALPSTGPAGLEIIPPVLLIMALGAYRQSRRRLQGVFLTRSTD